MRDAERFDAGEASVTIEDVQSEWDLPGFDIQTDVLLVFEGDDLVAQAEVPGWRADANVHPDWRDQASGQRFWRGWRTGHWRGRITRIVFALAKRLCPLL